MEKQIDPEALLLSGLPEDAPAVLHGRLTSQARARMSALGSGWDLLSLGPGTRPNVDVMVPGVEREDFADASLDTSSIALVLDCHMWSKSSVCITALNVSASTLCLAAS